MRTSFTRITLATLLALPLFGLPPALAQESPITPGVLDTAKVPGVMAKAVDGFIRPGYHHFTEEADTMCVGTLSVSSRMVRNFTNKNGC